MSAPGLDEVHDQSATPPGALTESVPRWFTGALGVVRTILEVGFIVVVIVAGLFLWPARLGGATTPVVVAGRSMEPTYQLGDLTIVRKGENFSAGDVIAFKVPKGDPGAGGTVIHRIIGGNGAEGYLTRGDANAHTDLWRPTDTDVLGKVQFRIPAGGYVLGWILSPYGIAAVATVIFVWVIWPRRADQMPREVGETTLDVGRG